MQNKYILLVEDNPDDVLLISRALKKNNIWNDIEVAADGVEALDFLYGTGKYCGRDISEVPAVVLLDLKLPRIDGFEVLRRMRAEKLTHHLPVFMVTSAWEVDDILRGYSLRADGYVCKSTRFDKFTSAIGHLGLDVLLAEEPALLPNRH
jgi:two-component system response regulator